MQIALQICSGAVDLAAHRRRLRFTAEVLDRVASKGNVLRIDPAAKLCAGKQCIVQSDGKLLYFDHNHVNLDGSRFVYPLIEAKLDQWLGNQSKRKAGEEASALLGSAGPQPRNGRGNLWIAGNADGMHMLDGFIRVIAGVQQARRVTGQQSSLFPHA